MFLNKLSLRNYRNYDQIDFSTDRNVNIIIGPNAQGKTNLLEAMFVMALTKSHRTSKDKELIRWDQTETQLHVEIEKKYGTCKLDLSITTHGKKAKINGLEQRRLSEFVGSMNTVMFAPEDLEIVKGGPGIRRRFLDMEISQVQPGYVYDLAQYQKIVNQRNTYLKTPSSADKAMMDVWNEQLAHYGVKIVKKRQSFIEKLQVWAEKIHAGITNGRERLAIRYVPSFEPAEGELEAVLIDRFMIKLTQVKEQELRRGYTMVGPHRDDLMFYINDKEVQTFGSQGQQRTTALSLKLAEIELIHEEVGEYPLLLLDDVLSELDPSRQTQLIETFQSKVQTFITTTSIESIDLSKLNGASLFHVVNGKVNRS